MKPKAYINKDGYIKTKDEDELECQWCKKVDCTCDEDDEYDPDDKVIDDERDVPEREPDF